MKHIRFQFKRKEKEQLIRILALEHGLFCWYCGINLKNQQIHIDHIVPRYHGGLDDVYNYALACAFCNYAKYKFHLHEFLSWLKQVKGERTPLHNFS